MFSAVLHVRGFLRISYASNGDVFESLLTSSIYIYISFHLILWGGELTLKAATAATRLFFVGTIKSG